MSGSIVFLGLSAWAALALGVACLVLRQALLFHYFVRSEYQRLSSNYTPKVSVIVPCKGVDPELEAGVWNILHQDYLNYEVLFVLATDSDPALPVLRRLIEHSLFSKAQIVFAGVPTAQRAEKVNNQLVALRQVSSDTEVYVFFDSDGRIPRDAIRQLVDPLVDPYLGASTGFRWFTPVDWNLGSWIRSAWNAAGLTWIADPYFSYAYGGAMAMRRETFHRIGVDRVWETAFSDDLELTQAVRKAGLVIHFVPTCLVPASEHFSLRQMLEWTTRQTAMARVYMSSFWVASSLLHGFSFFSALLAVVVLWKMGSAWSLSPGFGWVTGALLSPLLSLIFSAVIILHFAKQVLPREDKPGSLAWIYYLLLAPFASLTLFWNTLRSAFNTTIHWRGNSYRLRPILKTPQTLSLGKAGTEGVSV